MATQKERDALKRFDGNVFTTRDIDVILAMAKRTEAAEKRVDELNAGLDAQIADTKHLALKLKTAVTEHTIERDALKARVAELEEMLHKACGRIGGCLKVLCGPTASCKCDKKAEKLDAAEALKKGVRK